MEVAWTFERSGSGYLVRIDHQLRLPWPVIGGLVADRIIGPHFVGHIAGKTLATIKRIAESNDELTLG
jgi:predicted Kef-type K+ transport protein